MGSEEAIEALELLPLGALPPSLAEGLVVRLSRAVGLGCRLLPSDPRIELPLLPGRRQADADALLRLLEARPRGPGVVLVGLTGADIGHPVFTFFFGRARVGGGAALVSLARLDPAFYGLPADGDRTLLRATWEVLHELGHVAGLQHCEEPECLMRFAGNVEAIDVRGSHFCGACRQRLPPALAGSSG